MHNKRKPVRAPRWPLKKWALVFSILASATNVVEKAANATGKLYDALVPSNPVTYAQLESLRDKPKW